MAFADNIKTPYKSITATPANVPLSETVDVVLTTNPKYSTVTVDTEATPLPATPMVGRKQLRIRNAGLIDVIMCDSTGGAGYTIEPGDSIVYRAKDSTVVLYAKVESGTGTVEVEESK